MDGGEDTVGLIQRQAYRGSMPAGRTEREREGERRRRRRGREKERGKEKGDREGAK